MKFKEGDKVRVVSRKYGHCFGIGQEGLITEFFPKGKGPRYRVDSADDYWFMDDEELELIKN